MYTHNFKELDPKVLKLRAPELVIEDKTTGMVYVTTQKYMDKLVNQIGYRSTNVTRILEDYADMFINDIGNVGDLKIYADDSTGVFVVCTQNAVDWMNSLNQILDNKNYSLIQKFDNPEYDWSPILVRSPSGNYYFLYLSLLYESLTAALLSIDDEGVVTGMTVEGDFKMEEGQVSLDSLFITMDAVADISSEFTTNAKISLYEAGEFFTRLGWIGKKRGPGGFIYLKDSQDIVDDIDDWVTSYPGTPSIDLQEFVDDYNCADNWLKRHLEFVTDSIGTYKDFCRILSLHKDRLWEFRYFYNLNRGESSDHFLI